MLMPGLGERSLPARFRLSMALILTLIMLPAVRPLIKVDANSLQSLVSVLGTEFMIGLMLGLTARIALSCLEVAGVAIAQNMGLAFAMQIDPTQGGQSVAISNFLTITGITLILVSDLHHVSIKAIHDSYRLLEPGVMPASGDMANMLMRSVAAAFSVGVQIAAPFLVFSIVFNLGLGILAKLMPQIQIFFVAQPASIFLGTIILVGLLAVMMGVFFSHMESTLSQMLAP
jgi:flagellar biosynthesis protein FliR